MVPVEVESKKCDPKKGFLCKTEKFQKRSLVEDIYVIFLFLYILEEVRFDLMFKCFNIVSCFKL